MARRAIETLSLANPLYVGAVVYAYTVSGGAKTTTLATLYEASTGTGTLSNPQTLDSDGKWKQPVYIEDAVILSVTGLTVDDHDTGIIGGDLASYATEAAASAAAAAGSASDAAGSASDAADSAEAAAAILAGTLTDDDIGVPGGVQAYDADTLKADTDDVLAAGYGQGYQALGSLDAMTSDTLTITTIGTSNRKTLTVDVDGTIDVSGMAAGAILIRATNSGARSLTITGATVTAASAAFDGTDAAVNLLLFESDGTTVDLTIDQRGA